MAQQSERASACIRKYSEEESNQRRLIAKCLQMSRKDRLTKDGSYMPVKKQKAKTS